MFFIIKKVFGDFGIFRSDTDQFMMLQKLCCTLTKQDNQAYKVWRLGMTDDYDDEYLLNTFDSMVVSSL